MYIKHRSIKKLSLLFSSLASVVISSLSTMSSSRNYFLMKSEPDVFSITDLSELPDQTSPWDGVRNYEARNIMKSMNLGDRAFMYHSNAKKETGIVGIMEIVKLHYPDVTCMDPKSKYYDEKAKDATKWVCVDCKLVEIFKRPIYLDEMKSLPELSDLDTFKRSRLSITRVSQDEYNFVTNISSTTDRPTSLDKSSKKRKVKANDDDANNDEKEEVKETKKVKKVIKK